MSTKVNDTTEKVEQSVTSIYSDLLKKRREIKEEKEEKKRLKKEAENIEVEDVPEETPKTKKEKKEEAFKNWQTIIIGLTGEDLEYKPKRSNKKKYKKWIDDDIENIVLSAQKKKKKKKNYQKEFEPELNMLKNMVADQNRFTSDLQKRLNTMLGPNTKDSMPVNKTQVELASVINHSRSNALGVLREIGSVKKTIADLWFKQKKEDRDAGGASGFDTSDIGLMGSDIANELFGSVNNIQQNNNSIVPIVPNDPTIPMVPTTNVAPISFPKFDPNNWDGAGLDVGSTAFENIPKKIIVEWYKGEDKGRYKAIRLDDNTELIGCPLPKSKIKKIDEQNKRATDEFDQIYDLEIIE